MELLFSIHDVLGPDLNKALLTILNLVLIESLLSVDNAAVLATMVMDLPESQRNRALKYGILGAYFFRGVCPIFAAWLVNIWWLKPVGGLYLLYLTYDYFTSKQTETTEDDTLNKQENAFYKYTLGIMGPFWSTVALVELMDLAFSIDNVLAAVSLTENFPKDQHQVAMNLIYIGVAIGILAMRFVSQMFVNLMEKYPFLNTSAFIVIGILGLKLLLSSVTHFLPETNIVYKMLESENSDKIVSIITVIIFLGPIISSALWNFPKKSLKP